MLHFIHVTRPCPSPLVVIPAMLAPRCRHSSTNYPYTKIISVTMPYFYKPMDSFIDAIPPQSAFQPSNIMADGGQAFECCINPELFGGPHHNFTHVTLEKAYYQYSPTAFGIYVIDSFSHAKSKPVKRKSSAYQPYHQAHRRHTKAKGTLRAVEEERAERVRPKYRPILHT